MVQKSGDHRLGCRNLANNMINYISTGAGLYIQDFSVVVYVLFFLPREFDLARPRPVLLNGTYVEMFCQHFFHISKGIHL